MRQNNMMDVQLMEEDVYVKHHELIERVIKKGRRVPRAVKNLFLIYNDFYGLRVNGWKIENSLFNVHHAGFMETVMDIEADHGPYDGVVNPSLMHPAYIYMNSLIVYALKKLNLYDDFKLSTSIDEMGDYDAWMDDMMLEIRDNIYEDAYIDAAHEYDYDYDEDDENAPDRDDYIVEYIEDSAYERYENNEYSYKHDYLYELAEKINDIIVYDVLSKMKKKNYGLFSYIFDALGMIYDGYAYDYMDAENAFLFLWSGDICEEAVYLSHERAGLPVYDDYDFIHEMEDSEAVYLWATLI